MEQEQEEEPVSSPRPKSGLPPGTRVEFDGQEGGAIGGDEDDDISLANTIGFHSSHG